MHEGMERRTLLRLMASTPALCGLPLLTGCGGGSGASAGQDPGAGVGGGAQAALPGTDALTHLLRRTRFATTAAALPRRRSSGPRATWTASCRHQRPPISCTCRPTPAIR